MPTPLIIHDLEPIIHPHPAQSLIYMLQGVPEAILSPNGVGDARTGQSLHTCDAVMLFSKFDPEVLMFEPRVLSLEP